MNNGTERERERGKKSKPFLPVLKFTSLKVQDIKGRKMYISLEVFVMRGKFWDGELNKKKREGLFLSI